MDVHFSHLSGLAVIAPRVFLDARGYFFECWNKAVYARHGLVADFVQDNESLSQHGVIRGLHYQLPPYEQAKLIRVIFGVVLDVAVDLRRDSPTFGQSMTVVLSGENKKQVFIPRGFAHGFAVLSDQALLTYKTDNFYAPEYERGIAFDDKQLNLDWLLPPEKIIQTERDQMFPGFADAELP